MVFVDEVFFTQVNCGRSFRDGRRLEQLVRESDEGDHNPLQARFLELEAVEKRDGWGIWKLYVNIRLKFLCVA